MLQKLFFILIIIVAVAYHVFFRNFLFTFIGIGRVLQPLEDFAYECHRLEHLSLSSCEDLWLDEEERTLYAACGSMPTRMEWLPPEQFNTSGRQKSDHISVLDIDHRGENGLYGLRQLEVVGDYKGINRENHNVLDLHGFGVRKLDENRLQFFIINHRPPVDPITGNVVDNAAAVGANSTLEIFELARGSLKLEFVKTIVDGNLITPNDVAWVGEGRVLVTNDHLSKAGKLHKLQSFYGSGNVVSCDLTSEKCHPVVSNGAFANGVAQGHDGLIYVSHFITGILTVYRFSRDGSIVLVDTIDLKTPVDNMYVDTEGSLFIPGVPKVLSVFEALGSGKKIDIPSTVFRVRNLGDSQEPKFEVRKILEDREGRVLPATTGVVHDVKTGKLFLGGVGSPFMTVCERR